MPKIVESPSSEDALAFIKQHHKSRADKTLLIIIGSCMVDYKGRARSFLDWGERAIMIKQDGTLLVHQPVMREPINWQPPDSKTNFRIKDEKLVLKSKHKKPPEKMKITFRDIKTITVTSLKDQADLIISGMEADVVERIIEKPEDTIEEGLRVSEREKQVDSGMIDLYCFDEDHTPVVIEVKRSLATISAVHQLRMYVKDIKKDKEDAKVRGILCAPSVPEMVRKLLSDYDLEWKEVERKVILPDDNQKTLKDFV